MNTRQVSFTCKVAFSAAALCIPLAFSVGAAVAQAPGVQPSPASIGHFDPQGKPPSTFTLEIRNRFKAELPFSDKRDFEEARKGFIAEPPYKKIMADAGNVAWDMGSYQWLLSARTSRASIPRYSARPC